MKPPNHGLPVRVTTLDEQWPPLFFTGRLVLDPRPGVHGLRGTGLALVGEPGYPYPIYTTDRIELLP